MRVALALVLLSASLPLSLACSNVFSRKYEYEEEIFLALDRSATVNVNASVAALVALRGLDLPVDPSARLDREVVRDLYETPVTHVTSVNTSRRDGRRYVHLRIEVTDIRRLGEAGPFAWSSYAFVRTERDGEIDYGFTQMFHDAAGQDVGEVGWSGSELVALRVHVPSRIRNSTFGTVERGNIYVLEQPLADRLKGVRLEARIWMDPESILVRTLTLFGAMMAAVAATFAAFIWFVRSRRAPL